MASIAVTDGMDNKAVERLKKAGHDVVLKHIEPDDLLNGALSEFDAIIIRSATKLPADVINVSGDRLKVIGRAGVGVDNIDLAAAGARGIRVVNAPRASTQSVVELTLGHLLASIRHLPRADRSLRDGRWEKKAMKGSELAGKALGLIGFGRIAQSVGRVAQAIGMEVHAFDPFVDEAPEGVQLHDDVDEIFRYCTHISVHCNLNEQTRNLVNSERISMMPGIGLDGIECGNHIVSCARGGVVDESAASMALESGQLTSLALDVFEVEPLAESDLLRHDSFHGSPHIAASTLEAQARIGTEMAGLLIEYFETGRCHNSLN